MQFAGGATPRAYLIKASIFATNSGFSGKKAGWVAGLGLWTKDGSRQGQRGSSLQTMAYVPQVHVEQYESKLQDKVDKLKALFTDFHRLPELEVRAARLLMSLARPHHGAAT